MSHIVVVKTESGWAIRYLGTDPVTRYAPVREQDVRRALKDVEENEEVHI